MVSLWSEMPLGNQSNHLQSWSLHSHSYNEYWMPTYRWSDYFLISTSLWTDSFEWEKNPTTATPGLEITHGTKQLPRCPVLLLWCKVSVQIYIFFTELLLSPERNCCAPSRAKSKACYTLLKFYWMTLQSFQKAIIQINLQSVISPVFNQSYIYIFIYTLVLRDLSFLVTILCELSPLDSPWLTICIMKTGMKNNKTFVKLWVKCLSYLFLLLYRFENCAWWKYNLVRFAVTPCTWIRFETLHGGNTV